MTSEAAVSQEVARIEGLTARARAGLAAGQAIDLAELDRRIGALCASVQALPQDRARAFRARLLALYDELGRLAESVQETAAALQASLGETAKRRQAAAAYGGPPAARSPEDKSDDQSDQS